MSEKSRLISKSPVGPTGAGDSQRARSELLLFPPPLAALLLLGAGMAAPAHATSTPVTVVDWGAICDGASHPIGSTAPYSTMPQDQLHALFHFYTAPTDEVDGLAINQTLYEANAATLPATPGGAACVVNMSIVTNVGSSITGQGMGVTTVRFEVAAGSTVPDYPLFVAGALQNQATVPVSKIQFADFSVDGGWPPDGQHLGSPQPKAGAPGPVAFYFGANASSSGVSNVEVYHEYGTTVQVSGSTIDITGNFLHDNWGPTIHVSGTFPSGGGPPTYAANVQIEGNTLVHNSLQNYPARNANGGYGGLPSLMTGTGPYFVNYPAGPNANCPGGGCLGANDAITLDPLTQNGIISSNTIYGGDILVASWGYYQNGVWVQDEHSGSDQIRDNTVIASSGNGASVQGWPTQVTIEGNTFENMISMLDGAIGATPPTLSEQLSDNDAHACELMSGPAEYVTVQNNSCTGGTITPDYSVYPPSFTSPNAVTTPSVAWGFVAYATGSQGKGNHAGSVMAPTNSTVLGNTYTNTTQAGGHWSTSIIDFKNTGAVLPDEFRVSGNILVETRGLTPVPFEYSISMVQAGPDMNVYANTPLMGSKGIADVAPGQSYQQGH